LFQRAQLDAAIDQTADNAENGRVSGQLMAEALRQNLKFVQLCHRMLNDNPIFSKKAVVRLLLLCQRMVSFGFDM